MIIDENVIICTVLKNVENCLKKGIQLCIDTSKLFKECKIIIYENNSTDKTKEILATYGNHPNMIIISEDIAEDEIKSKSRVWAYTKITGSDHPCRCEQIANARNKVVNEFQKPEYSHYTYIVWIDIDTNYWSIDGIKDSFDKKEQWDAIFANGIWMNKYYDLFAYRDLKQNFFGGELLGDLFLNINRFGDIDYLGYEALIPVVSAFGGIGIYKKHLFDNTKYDCIVTEDIKQYYTSLLSNHNFDDELLKIISSPCSKFDGGYITTYHNGGEKQLYWKNNAGYDNVVICEHVSINVPLFMQGHRLAINPKMIYIWAN